MKNLFSICFILFCFFGIAQNKQKESAVSIVSYEVTSIVTSDALKDIPKEYQELQEMIKKQKQAPRYYDLMLKDQEALYKKTVKKAREQSDEMNTGNIQMKETVIGFGETIEMYENFKTKSVITSANILDKEFLISENLKSINWKLINETKTIGSLECKKAQAEIGGDFIEAWYAPSIPTMAGPSIYWGLPGLIVEVKNKTQQYLATQIKENIAGTIVVPTKGKKISREEFKKLVNERVNDFTKDKSTFKVTTVGN